MGDVDNNADFESYHRSITGEFHAIKDRIRHLIHDRHWLTDGEFKEAALRMILRRHLPESALIGKGFIVGEQTTSTQIDILITDGGSPTLFKDGDLMIVTPDAVRGIIEVKTQLKYPQEIRNALVKLATNGGITQKLPSRQKAWTGLFIYEGCDDIHQTLLQEIGHSYQETGYPINCISYGKNIFVRHWDDNNDGMIWRSYELTDLAPSYFIGNLISSFIGASLGVSNYAWFPKTGGKERHARWEFRERESKLRQIG